jgi:hypothetical protein
MAMNTFDKICAALAFVLGLALMLLGVFGVFTGCKANFALPPILGGLPILVAWGILKPVVLAWRSGRKPPDSEALGHGI